jgi:hypothetical protein
MKRLLIVLFVLLAAPVGATVYLWLMKPAQRPPSTEKVELTPERIERGEYLVEILIGCPGCHASDFQWDVLSFPPKEGEHAVGGFCFDRENMGFPGKICAQNITSDPETGLGGWTDGEIMRAIREGVGRDGNALMPAMPYEELRYLSDEDTRAVVAYLRTLPPVKKRTPAGYIDFPINLLLKLAPKPLDGPVPEPDRKDAVAYGRYLSRIIGCHACHTPVDSFMNSIDELAFSGGREFDLSRMVPGFKQRTPNITPDDETGIGKMTKETFVARFKAFADPSFEHMKVPPEQNTVMQWVELSNLTEEDLGAIYDYLRTVPAIKNVVADRRPPAKFSASP